MGKKKRKTRKALVSLELGLGGLLGLAVASFCIFLWMFLFGMWTGQTVLQTSDSLQSINDMAGFSAKVSQKTPEGKETAKKAITKSGLGNRDIKGGKVEKEVPEDQEASFFAVQVAAFKEEQRAVNSVLQWRARDYESFYLRPDSPNGIFHRVFVGRFESLAEANTLAAKLESAEQRKVFIMLVSVDQEQLP